MLSVERQKFILDRIYKKGSVKVSELSKKFQVHEETIRRDLKSLASQYNIELIYGGACLNSGFNDTDVKEMAFSAKRSKNSEEKIIIAKKAAALINPGETIALNSGSTVEYILDFIRDKLPLNIVTINVNIAAKAALIDGIDVYLPGGKVRNKSGTVIGPGSIEYLKSFSIDKYFVGSSAVSLSKGICHPILEEIDSNRALFLAANKSYLVCDSSKIGKTAIFKMFDIDDMDACIIDNELPDDFKNYLSNLKITII